MYNNHYHFYLEKKDDYAEGGPYLKYGRKGKNVTTSLDLNGLLVFRDESSQTKFKIVTQSQTLHLKAESNEQREHWIASLMKVSQKQEFIVQKSKKRGRRSKQQGGIPNLAQITEVLQSHESNL